MFTTRNLMIGAFLAPVILAIIVLKLDWHPANTTNNGQFMQQEVVEPQLANENLWTVAVYTSKACGSACDAQILGMEKLQTALLKHQDKVGFVQLGSSEITHGFKALSGQYPLKEKALYLVDAQGLFVLEYEFEENPKFNRLIHKGLLSDVKKLLKYARQQ